jgi:hypothetical protein
MMSKKFKIIKKILIHQLLHLKNQQEEEEMVQSL